MQHDPVLIVTDFATETLGYLKPFLPVKIRDSLLPEASS